MSKAQQPEQSIDQLVERFTDLAVEQDGALLRGDVDKVNQLNTSLSNVEIELKQHAGDQRKALVCLYDHPNPQVRLKAAKATLAVVPDLAVTALKNAAESTNLTQAGDAGMTLLGLERGWYTPT